MDSRAVAEALEAIGASFAALAAGVRRGLNGPGVDGADLLRDRADACLDGMAQLAGMEAGMAALKVHLAAGYAETAAALAPPAVSPQEHTVRDMAIRAEVACVLTVSERTAGALLSEAHALTTALPLTLSALGRGVFRGSTPGSWWMKPRTWTGLEPPAWRHISWTPTH